MAADDLKAIRDRWDFANEADKNQRERERADLSFYEGEGQWDSDIRTLRQGMAASGNTPAVPARPCLTINKIRDPIRKIQNDELQADLGMSIAAADDFDGQIDENEITLREGLGRRIQRDSYAKDARMWGANRAAISGRGFWGITTAYVDGDTFDQEIRYELFYDQFSVLPDPTHEQPDGSDAEFYFVGRDFPLDIYRDKFPYLADGSENPLSSSALTDSEWRAFCDDAPGWVREDGKNRTVRVTRYWHYERETYQIVLLDDGSIVRADTLDKEFLKTIKSERKRDRVVKRVKSTLLDGVNILEEVDWPGKYIPIIKVVGERIHTFDKERRDEGMVRPARDPQKAYNAMISAAVETVAMAPKSPWLVPFRAVENFQDQWKESATRNWPALYFNDVDPDTGQPITPPQRNQAEPPIQAMAAMLGAFDQGIMATIGQANLADTHPDVRSGAMASRLLDEAARGTSNYLANLIRSVHYEGMIVNDLLYPIYGMRPGRIVSMVNGSGKSERVMIQTPFVTQPQAGAMPQPHDPNNPEHAQMQPKTYTLTKDGSFNVAIEATKFYETRKQEKVSLMASMLEKSPEQVTIMGDLFFDAIGEEDIAKRYRAVLAPPIQAMLREGQPPDPRLEQAMEMGRQVSQELMQLKADKGARIEQAQIKALADTTTSDKDNETKILIARIQQETAVMVADLKATVQQQADAAQGIQEQMRTLVELLNEERLASKQREHERESQHHAQAHELGMAIVEHKHAKDALEHEAATMPSPNGSGE